MEKLYRYERGNTDKWEPSRIVLFYYKVDSVTPKGFWIKVDNHKKWVSNEARKRFAYPTEDLAFENFKQRTNRCVKILTANLEVAKRFQKDIKNGTIRKSQSSYSG